MSPEGAGALNILAVARAGEREPRRDAHLVRFGPRCSAETGVYDPRLRFPAGLSAAAKKEAELTSSRANDGTERAYARREP